MAEDSKNNNEQKTKKRNIIMPLAILLCILGGSYLIYQGQFQSTDDAYVEADIIQVTPKVSGHIIESYIQDNKEIKAPESNRQEIPLPQANRFSGFLL